MTVPLSDTRSSGRPGVANNEQRCSMVERDVATFSALTSIHLEWASTVTKNM